MREKGKEIEEVERHQKRMKEEKNENERKKNYTKMVTDSGHIQNGENNRMVNHGEYYDFLYVFQPETLHSHTAQIHVCM